MTDELDVVAGLSPEQVVERARALLLEAEYWRHMLADLRDVGSGARDAVAAIVTSTGSAIALVPQADAGLLVHAETIVAENRKALNALEQVAAGLDRLADLAEGRQKALEPVGDALMRAAGSEPGDATDSEAS